MAVIIIAVNIMNRIQHYENKYSYRFIDSFHGVIWYFRLIEVDHVQHSGNSMYHFY
jgi:hypothetical protein